MNPVAWLFLLTRPAAGKQHVAQVAAMGLDGLKHSPATSSPEQIQAFLLKLRPLPAHLAGSDFHGGPGEPELGAAAVDLTLPWLMD